MPTWQRDPRNCDFANLFAAARSALIERAARVYPKTHFVCAANKDLLTAIDDW
jgi:hypothetical protein